MTDKETKKRLINAYKERAQTQTGGVYLIRNNANGRVLVDVAADMAAAVNRFNFTKQMNTCVNAKLTKDWAHYGSGVFELEVAETMDKSEKQSPAEFLEDLQVLKKMWQEKFEPAVLY
jgi:hypothetical protein